MSGLLRYVAEHAGLEAREYRAEAAALRAKADEADRVAETLEELDRVAQLHLTPATASTVGPSLNVA